MSDKYDAAIEYLTARPSSIPDAWGMPRKMILKGGCLFRFASRDGGADSADGREVGCLTSIRGGVYEAETRELTDAIRADARIPSDESKITVADLPVFAEWQRRIDKELGRV